MGFRTITTRWAPSGRRNTTRAPARATTSTSGPPRCASTNSRGSKPDHMWSESIFRPILYRAQQVSADLRGTPHGLRCQLSGEVIRQLSAGRRPSSSRTGIPPGNSCPSAKSRIRPTSTRWPMSSTSAPTTVPPIVANTCWSMPWAHCCAVQAGAHRRPIARHRHNRKGWQRQRHPFHRQTLCFQGSEACAARDADRVRVPASLSAL